MSKQAVLTCELDEQELQELLDGTRDKFEFVFEDDHVTVEVVRMQND